jgi:AraC-like DNA-binding protein
MTQTDAGFNNLSNFIEQFKRSTGMSLSEYRHKYHGQTLQAVL